METKNINIHCVDMVRKIRDKNYQITKNMSSLEKKIFIKQNAEDVHKSKIKKTIKSLF